MYLNSFLISCAAIYNNESQLKGTEISRVAFHICRAEGCFLGDVGKGWGRARVRGLFSPGLRGRKWDLKFSVALFPPLVQGIILFDTTWCTTQRLASLYQVTVLTHSWSKGTCWMSQGAEGRCPHWTAENLGVLKGQMIYPGPHMILRGGFWTQGIGFW